MRGGGNVKGREKEIELLKIRKEVKKESKKERRKGGGGGVKRERKGGKGKKRAKERRKVGRKDPRQSFQPCRSALTTSPRCFPEALAPAGPVLPRSRRGSPEGLRAQGYGEHSQSSTALGSGARARGPRFGPRPAGPGRAGAGAPPARLCLRALSA